MEKTQLLWQLAAYQFASFDVQLYLDTHPYDQTACQIFEKYLHTWHQMKSKYEASYGPLSADTANGSACSRDLAWAWLTDPWPWEKEAN
jgi:spore coat protein JB